MTDNYTMSSIAIWPLNIHWLQEKCLFHARNLPTDVTVLPLKPVLHDIVTSSLKSATLTFWGKCNDVVVYAIYAKKKYEKRRK